MKRQQKNVMVRKSITTIKDPIWKELVTNLQANTIYYRQRRSWTQTELALKAKLNVATIADIEQGKAINPRIESIASLTKAFNLKDSLALLKPSKY